VLDVEKRPPSPSGMRCRVLYAIYVNHVLLSMCRNIKTLSNITYRILYKHLASARLDSSIIARNRFVHFMNIGSGRIVTLVHFLNIGTDARHKRYHPARSLRSPNHNCSRSAFATPPPSAWAGMACKQDCLCLVFVIAFCIIIV
jgi:hypothetical protein